MVTKTKFEDYTDNTYLNSETKWKSISLTHVEYPEGDSFGKLLAVSSLSPVIILCGFAVLMLFRRELHTISFFLGLLVNESINYILKNTIKEPRPSYKGRVLFSEFGMPSSHAQFMIFFSIYLSLFLQIRVHHNINFVENIWKHILTVGTLSHAVVVCYSRIYLLYHSSYQVVCGAALGALFGVVWFAIIHCVLTQYFPIIASWKISEIFMIRDSTLIPNILRYEYISCRGEARSRLRKLAVRKSP